MKNISITLKAYIIFITGFTFFRILLFITNWDKAVEIDGTVNWLNLFISFFMGLRFDIVVSGYFLLLFYVVFSFFDIIGKKPKVIMQLLFIYLVSASFLAMLISAIDVPFFNQFYSRINVSALQWIDSPVFILKMIIEEPRYYLFVLPFLVLIFIMYRIFKKIFRTYDTASKVKPQIIYHISFSLLFLFVMLIGIRGRVEIKSPIRIGTAYFSSNSFLNQAGLNPVFSFITSVLDKTNPQNKYLTLMDDEHAVKNVQKYLGIKEIEFDSPIARWIVPQEISHKNSNVVIVIMEAMSAAKMGRYGSKDNLTPNLDNLAVSGICFDNIYTAGIHTYNGVFGTLFSFPSLASQHPMKASNMLKYNGIAGTLQSYGYQTLYFTTHDGQFDNAEGFLYHNSFERVYTKSDYPPEKILSTLGVPDDYLFEFVNNKLDEAANHSKPFLAAILTASDHGPYIIPDYFNPKPNDITKQIVEYADWSIGKFISAARTKKWFDNTIFVFIADHGAALSPVYEMPLNYHHSPLIIYSPKLILQPKVYSQIGGQIDVFPTVMGLLKLPYINNALGINLLREKRPYIYFSADEKYGVLSDSLFLIVNNYGRESLFKYRNNDQKNYFDAYKNEADEMKLYAISNMQAAQYLIKNNKQFIANNKNMHSK